MSLFSANVKLGELAMLRLLSLKSFKASSVILRSPLTVDNLSEM